MTLFADTELFTSGKLTEKSFDIPEAELKLYEHFIQRNEADCYYETLLKETTWKQEQITIHERTMNTPRLISWYGKHRRGTPDTPLTPTLQEIKDKVEEQSGTQFTSVLLNLYRTGNDSVAWHRDHEREFGINPIIGSVSFGETRPF